MRVEGGVFVNEFWMKWFVFGIEWVELFCFEIGYCVWFWLNWVVCVLVGIFVVDDY